jgi:multidrug resistance efflux pump
MHILPVLVWLAAVALVVLLLQHRAQRFEIVGFAQGRVYTAAANCQGRLKDINVELFETVGQGQALAVVDTVLDNENLNAQLNTALVEVHRIKAELAATEEQLQVEAANTDNDWVAAQRRFSVDLENARIRILEIKTQLETDRIALRDLEVEKQISQSLLDQQAVAPYELQKVQLQYDALAKQVEENEHLLQQATEVFLNAQQRSEQYAQLHPRHPSLQLALKPIQEAIAVQEQRVEELRARAQPVILEAPFAGLVSRIDHRPGDAVLAGEPILTVTEAEPREVIAYVSQNLLGRVREMMDVELVTTSEPVKVAPSQVTGVGPGVELMPERLWANPNIPEWGRPILIKIPPGLELVPGELVGVRGL